MKQQKNQQETFVQHTKHEPLTTTSGNVNPETGEQILFKHPFSRQITHVKNIGKPITHQNHAETCDINAIIRKYDRTGSLPPPTRPAQYADVSELNGDLTEQINKSLQTQQQFNSDITEYTKKRTKKQNKTSENNDLQQPSPEDTKPDE